MTALTAALVASPSPAQPPCTPALTENPTTTSAQTEAPMVQTSSAAISPTATPQDIYARFGRSACEPDMSTTHELLMERPTVISFGMSQ